MNHECKLFSKINPLNELNLSIFNIYGISRKRALNTRSTLNMHLQIEYLLNFKRSRTVGYDLKSKEQRFFKKVCKLYIYNAGDKLQQKHVHQITSSRQKSIIYICYYILSIRVAVKYDLKFVTQFLMLSISFQLRTFQNFATSIRTTPINNNDVINFMGSTIATLIFLIFLLSSINHIYEHLVQCIVQTEYTNT